MFFSKNITIYNSEATTDEEVIHELSSKLIDKGIVKESYYASIIERERKFPTGLPTEPLGIAIPHTDSEHVLQSQIAFATLKNPVKFKVMGGGEEKVKVSIIFMLALKESNDQLKVLQNLINCFQNEDLINKFSNVDNDCEFRRILKENQIA